MDRQRMEKQVVSKKRVADHGEVYTGTREVNAMLDLVKQETERIESRFLEPACGTGNFLTEILQRKLQVVESRYSKSQLEYERKAVLAVSSIYGVDILEDNVVECRRRLFEIFNERYVRLFGTASKDKCRDAVRYILEKNIIWGDALTLTTVGDAPAPIVFSEWSAPFNDSRLKRRDFAFHELLPGESQPTLFTAQNQPQYSDVGGRVFIPEPVREYPPIHYLRVADAEQNQS